MKKAIWKCKVKGCGFATLPTLEGFNQMVGHQLHHSKAGTPKEKRGFHLVDQGTGDLLARTLKEARKRGLLEPTSSPTPRAPVVQSQTPPVIPSEKATSSPYQQGYDHGYDKGYDDGVSKTMEDLRNHVFESCCPRCGFVCGVTINARVKEGEGEENQEDEAVNCHLKCSSCGLHFLVTKALIKHIIEIDSAFVECPYCQCEDHYHFSSHPGLAQVCQG